MNWTLEQRYQRIEDMPEGYFDALNTQRKQDSFYPSFHIAPPYGLLNDPNGLSHFNGEHHIFINGFRLVQRMDLSIGITFQLKTLSTSLTMVLPYILIKTTTRTGSTLAGAWLITSSCFFSLLATSETRTG
ncbi:sucrose-6-phosphate hydrolase [Vibrio maritimus]|uniref:Sucrose-6-phosphate hydrolase n=1 Tax=Vibrio maritimus TaxID=990268 RepID=A0A090SMF9_9VIBR|nr:sucrose-6-phosphate hydrolase [Vibrio maritimus]